MKRAFAIGLLIAANLRGQPNPSNTDQAPAIITPEGGGWLGALRRPYQTRQASSFDPRNSPRVYDLLRAGNLYLSLSDAIALAIENNLDVEISRLQFPIASSDVERAKGGGGLRGISYTTTSPPPGVGGPAGPLLNIAAASATPSTSVPGDVTDLSLLVQPVSSSSILPGDFAAGPAIPVFDPAINGSLYRTREDLPNAYPGARSFIDTSTLGFLGLQQGYSLGGTYAVGFTSQSQNYASQIFGYNPFSTGNLQFTVTQPLLRGFGLAVNRRFIEVGKNDEKITSLSFRQQLINTVFGISRLYYDLLALSEDLNVKQETLRAANRLQSDTQAGVEEGTIAPIELTRAQAQVAGAEQDLVVSRGLFDEEEVIMKNLLSRRGTGDPLVQSAHIVPTESVAVPQQEVLPDLNDLYAQANRNRPDLQQANLQIDNADILLKATRNAILPQFDIVGTFATSGATGDSTNPLINPSLIGGYSNLLAQLFSKNYPTYSVGVQLNLPLRNRVAQGDLVRDEFQRREAQARQLQFQNQARLEVEDALVGLKRSRAAFDAAVRTRALQEQALAIERVRYEAGVDTAFFVIQYQSYVAQAQSTELIARSNYFKAKAALDRAVGASLEANNISIDEAYHGRLKRRSEVPAGK